MSDQTVPAVLPESYVPMLRSCIDCGDGRYHSADHCPQRASHIAELQREAREVRQRLANLTREPA